MRRFLARSGVDDACEPRPDAGSRQAEALVIGGGVAGLAAARALTDAGVRVLIVEGRERLRPVRRPTESVRGARAAKRSERASGFEPAPGFALVRSLHENQLREKRAVVRSQLGD